MKKLKSQYYYMKAHVSYNKESVAYSLSPSLLQVIIKPPLEAIFGETASAYPIDVLQFDEANSTAIIRVQKEIYVKMRAAMTYLSSMTIDGETVPVTISVISASPCLLSLASPRNPMREIS